MRRFLLLLIMLILVNLTVFAEDGEVFYAQAWQEGIQKYNDISINNRTCPIEIIGFYRPSKKHAHCISGIFMGKTSSDQPILSFEVRVVTLDAGLNPLVTLSTTEAIRLVGKQYYGSPVYNWYLAPDDMENYFMTVTYIAEVKMRGRVWRCDTRSLVEFLKRIDITCSERDLEPTVSSPEREK
ncbi:MAG TPA: hypothetical protein VHR47_01330 [Bacillota bacterium]|nr:hypothetical protein [Bacillota bacterium]